MVLRKADRRPAMSLYLLLLSVALSAASCKPKSQAKLKDLESLEGVGARRNDCGIASGSGESLLTATDVTLVGNASKVLIDVVLKTSAAVPPGVLEYFRMAQAKIIVTPDVAKECNAFKPVLDFDGAKRWDLNKGDSCLIVDTAVSSHQSQSAAMPAIAIVVRADEGVIRDALVRQFGALFSTVMTSAVTVADYQHSKVGLFRFDYYESAKKALVSAYIWDLWANKLLSLYSLDRLIGPGTGKLLVPHLVAVNKKTARGVDLSQFLLPVAPSDMVKARVRMEAFLMQVMTEAFDQYYCNAYAAFNHQKIKNAVSRSALSQALATEHNTRKIMSVLFPNTLAVFTAVIVPALERLPLVESKKVRNSKNQLALDDDSISIADQRQNLAASYTKLYNSGFLKTLQDADASHFNTRLDKRAQTLGQKQFVDTFFQDSLNDRLDLESARNRENSRYQRQDEATAESRARIQALKSNPDAIADAANKVSAADLTSDQGLTKKLQPFSGSNPFTRFTLNPDSPDVKAAIQEHRATWSTDESTDYLLKNPSVYYESAFAREAAGKLPPEKQQMLKQSLEDLEEKRISRVDGIYLDLTKSNQKTMQDLTTRIDLRNLDRLDTITNDENFSQDDRELAKWFQNPKTAANAKTAVADQGRDKAANFLPPESYKDNLIKSDVADMKATIAPTAAAVTAVGIIPGANTLAGLSDAGLQLYAGYSIDATNYMVKDAAMSAVTALPIAGSAGFIAKAETFTKASGSANKLAAGTNLAATTVGTGALAYNLQSAATSFGGVAVDAMTAARSDPGFANLSESQKELVTRATLYNQDLGDRYLTYAKIAKARTDTLDELKSKLATDSNFQSEFAKDPEAAYRKAYDSKYAAVCKAAATAGMKLTEGADSDPCTDSSLNSGDLAGSGSAFRESDVATSPAQGPDVQKTSDASDPSQDAPLDSTTDEP